jgi:Carboxypeptidase regulatory-like domain/TonB dependent receptor-like, beta-barrel
MTLRCGRRSITQIGLALAALVLSLLNSRPARAQVAGATLSGLVSDPSGAVIPAADVSVRNVATGVTTAVKTDSVGFYTVPNLVPGSYDVTVTAAGFSTQVRSGIALTVGAQQSLNVVLAVGQATEKVEVTGAAPAVQLASSTLSAVVTSNTVVELPLNGRDWTQLAALQAGVSALPNQVPVSQSRSNRGYGQQMSISGTRPQLNNYRLDGISIVDYAGGPPGSLLGVSLGVDAVGEFSVLTSNYSAEYGRTAGGVVNAITRSGTNQLHGDAYWFLRDEDFDARNFFDSTIPPFHRNQFGGSLGGPIRKDKTFFFADYEGLREALGVTTHSLVPSPAARAGNLSTGTITVSPLVEPYLAFYPLPNGGLTSTGDTGFFNFATNPTTRENFITNRIDHKLSEKDSIYGSWFWDKAVQTSPDPLDSWVFGTTTLRMLAAVEETHVFSPSLVNSVRGGYSRIVALAGQPISVINPVAADKSLGSFPGRTAVQLQVEGLFKTFGGLGGLPQPDHTWNSFQVYDDAFLTRGAHSMKFGFAFERMQHDPFIFTQPNGTFIFGSLKDFLTDVPVQFTAQPPDKVTPRGVRQSLFGGYVQDDWRWRPNLTLNLGLRYEMVTVPTEVQGKLANLRTPTSPTPFLGSPFFNNPTYRNFEPRVGFAWDPFHNGTTAVRGAFGIFDLLPLNYEFFQQEAQTAPFSEVFAANFSGINVPDLFPTAGVALLAGKTSSLQSAFIQFNPPRNYALIWNLNVQHQLTPSTSLMIGYVGNHGVHMVNREDDINSVLPIQTSPGLLFPFPALSGTILNPTWGGIRGVFWSGTSLYDALETQVTKRMSHGFQIQGAYTWGKNIDSGSATTIGDPYVNSIPSLIFFCNSCRRGLSDFNIAQKFVLNYLWDIPTPKNWGSIGSHVLGGWEVGGIYTAETGVPLTPLIGGDPVGLNSSDTWEFPDRLTGPGCSSLVNPGNPDNYIKLNCFGLPQATPAIAALCTPFVPGGPPNPPAAGTCSNLWGNAGRNIVVGPGLETLDFSLFKNNYIKRISESFNVQFRAEFFNIFNRSNFATPVDNSTLFDQSGAPVGGAGAVDVTSATAREIQFALKLIW